MTKTVIFSRYITLRNGKRLDARACGKQAFRFEVDDDKAPESSANSDTERPPQGGAPPVGNVISNDDSEDT